MVCDVDTPAHRLQSKTSVLDIGRRHMHEPRYLIVYRGTNVSTDAVKHHYDLLTKNKQSFGKRLC